MVDYNVFELINYCITKLYMTTWFKTWLSHMATPIKGNNAFEVRACFYSGVVDCEIHNKHINILY